MASPIDRSGAPSPQSLWGYPINDTIFAKLARTQDYYCIIMQNYLAYLMWVFGAAICLYANKNNIINVFILF
jgi:hypothetical protein